jgi:chemotaxis-related protein WspB
MIRAAGTAVDPTRGPMLLLTFRAAESLYAVDVARVVEVVPRIDLRRLPHAPAFLAGVFDYRGTVVPVIDLGILLGSEACRYRLSTRIILVNSRPADRNHQIEPGKTREHDQAEESGGNAARAKEPRPGDRPWLLGLIAEQVSDVSAIKPEQVISSAMQLPQSPYLGAIVEIDHAMAQLIEPDRILDESLRTAFFGGEAGADSSANPRANAKAGST